jgi:hypothetical protein
MIFHNDSIEGRILTINVISDKSAQIVLVKLINRKKTPIAINIWGFWKSKMDALKLKPKDKIFGKVYAKSTLWKNKWYTDLYFKDIELVPDKPKKTKENAQDLFIGEYGINDVRIIDEETGEILL